jgi:hypothetical protein
MKNCPLGEPVTGIGHKATKPTRAEQANKDLQALPELILKVIPHQIAKWLMSQINQFV